uniref:SLC13 family permease n=1 Tax=Collinsella intestinalis TaxID=147207 RepID=UPI004029E805
MQLPLIDRIRSFIQAEAVLVVAALAALLSTCLFPPVPQNWSAYAEAIDWRTIGLLFCLMTVVAGFTRAGLLARVRSLLTRTEGTQRRLSLLLVTLSFFTAMIVTNDVALISFAPLTLLLFQGSEPRSTIITLVAQTVAANLGSMMTPIGNPQNIYLYSAFELELGEFLTAIAPYGIIGFLASIAPCMLIPNTKATLGKTADSKVDTRLAHAYGALFLLALACVGRVMSWELCVLITLIGCLIFDRSVLKHLDYSLLITFACSSSLWETSSTFKSSPAPCSPSSSGVRSSSRLWPARSSATSPPRSCSPGLAATASDCLSAPISEVWEHRSPLSRA